MPASIVKSFADKTGKSEKEVDKLWNKAKTLAKKDGRKESEDNFFPYVTGILKNMLKIDEDVLPIDEAAKEDEKKLIIQAIGKDKYNKYKKDITTKVIGGDFVVYDRGTILGKIKKGEWTKPKWMGEATVKPKFKVGSVFKYYSKKSQKTLIGKVASVELEGKDIIYGLETGGFVRQSDLVKLKENYIPSFKEFVKSHL